MRIGSILLVFFFALQLNAQDSSSDLSGVYPSSRVAVGMFRHFQFDVGYGVIIFTHDPFNAFVTEAAFEMRDFRKDALYGPKIYVSHIQGFHNTAIELVTAADVIDYTDFKNRNSPCIRPDIGISVIGIFDLTYGYNFFLSGKPGNSYFNDHVVTFVIRPGIIRQLLKPRSH